MEKASSKNFPDEDETSIDVQQEPEPRLGEKDGPPPTNASEPKPHPENQDVEIEYITGWKLILATGIVALASFTMLLDTSIVVTVSQIAEYRRLGSTDVSRQFPASQAISIH